MPTLLIISLVIIPYFNVNIEANGHLSEGSHQAIATVLSGILGMLIFLLVFHVYVAVSAHGACGSGDDRHRQLQPDSPSRLRRYLVAGGHSLLLDGITWFLFELIVLTAVGTWFPAGLVLGLALEELSAIHQEDSLLCVWQHAVRRPIAGIWRCECQAAVAGARNFRRQRSISAMTARLSAAVILHSSTIAEKP